MVAKIVGLNFPEDVRTQIQRAKEVLPLDQADEPIVENLASIAAEQRRAAEHGPDSGSTPVFRFGRRSLEWLIDGGGGDLPLMMNWTHIVSDGLAVFDDYCDELEARSG